jgi:hypothetical protein
MRGFGFQWVASGFNGRLCRYVHAIHSWMSGQTRLHFSVVPTLPPLACFLDFLSFYVDVEV